MAEEDLDICAFPVAVPSEWEMFQDGMGLRDWFAGQALAGIMANPTPLPLDENYYKFIVDRAYWLGQMMLVARQKYESKD